MVGVAWWRELAKAMMMREEDGLLKILVSPEDRRLLGVHVIGAQATDLVHIGQALMDRENGLDFLVSTVFNYPTLAEAYKVAGLDALNRIRDLSVVGRRVLTRAGGQQHQERVDRFAEARGFDVDEHDRQRVQDRQRPQPRRRASSGVACTAPAIASAASTQNAITPTWASDSCSPIACADWCQA